MDRAQAVIASLKTKPLQKGVTLDDWEHLTATAQRYLDAGWEESDVRALLRCTEELNPALSEATALRRMSRISNKYKGEPKMVEKAGTGSAESTPMDTDTNMEEQRELYASKPALPDPVDDYSKLDSYIGDLAVYYVKQLEFDNWPDAEKAIKLFKDMYSDALRDKEFMT